MELKIVKRACTDLTGGPPAGSAPAGGPESPVTDSRRAEGSDAESECPLTVVPACGAIALRRRHCATSASASTKRLGTRSPMRVTTS